MATPSDETLEDFYRNWGDYGWEGDDFVVYTLIEADLDAWEKYVDEGIDALAYQYNETYKRSGMGQKDYWPEIEDVCAGCDTPVIGCRC